MITNFCIAVSPEGEKTINKEEIIKERLELLWTEEKVDSIFKESKDFRNTEKRHPIDNLMKFTNDKKKYLKSYKLLCHAPTLPYSLHQKSLPN